MKRPSTSCAVGSWARGAFTTASALCFPLLMPAAAGQVFASAQQQAAQPAAVPLKQLLQQWEKQYSSSIGYESDLIGDKVVLPQPGEGSLEDKLRGVLAQVGLQFEKLQPNFYVVLPAPPARPATAPAGAAADIPVTGRVTQADGQPLPGVTVVVKGTTQGTSTDGNGSFSLTVPSGSVLIFSSIGFVAQEVPVTGPTLTVVLSENTKALDEVVVVGYGVQRKSDLTGSVASADIDAFREAPNTNIAQSLQGTVPGLNVGQVTSAGATPSIQVRGANTINGNADVLIVLDGIIYNGPLSSINPDDIASIDVLKDASSTAVYGAQAANGVLLITSRKGKAGKTRIAYSGSYATQEPSVDLRPENRDEYLQRIRDLNYTQAYLAPEYTTPNPAFDITRFVNPIYLTNGALNDNSYDWWGGATQRGNIQDHQLSVSGGSEKTTFLVSGGYTKQLGYIINDKFNRKSVRINLETQATPWWKIGAQTLGSFTDLSGEEPDLQAIVRHSPFLNPYDAAGNLIPFPTQTLLANPYMTFDVDDYEKRATLFGNFYSEISAPFLKGLTYRLNFGNNYRTENHYNANRWGAGQTGSAYKDQNTYYDYTLDNILTYNRAFGKHELTGTLLYSAIERQYSQALATASGFSNITLGYNSLEQGNIQRTSSDAWREALNAQMARLNYKFADRYLLTATVRRDGFSGFATREKYGVFPSAALGWILTNEPFFKLAPVNFLKLRAGYGTSGNLTSRYSSLATVAPSAAYIFGDGGTTQFGQQVQSLANPNLKWESTQGFNAGLDFVLLKNRLSGSLDYYNNQTNDLLFDVALPTITGFQTIRTNVGSVANTGLELSLTSVNVETKSFKWSSTFNISGNRNKIIRLVGLDADGDGQEDDLVASNLFIGKSIRTYYDLKADGLYQLGDEIPAGYFPGTYRIVDANGDGRLERATDRVFLGRQDPAYRTSLLNTFEYKGLTLRVFLNAVQGSKNGYLGVNNPGFGNSLSDNSRNLNYLSGIDFWSPSNPDAVYARSPVTPSLGPSFYQQRNFVRLQDISLSYRFGGSILKTLRADNLSVFVSAKNVATWTDWNGWDPEAETRNSNGTITLQGLTDSGRPVLKGYSFGLNVAF